MEIAESEMAGTVRSSLVRRRRPTTGDNGLGQGQIEGRFHREVSSLLINAKFAHICSLMREVCEYRFCWFNYRSGLND